MTAPNEATSAFFLSFMGSAFLPFDGEVTTGSDSGGNIPHLSQLLATTRTYSGGGGEPAHKIELEFADGVYDLAQRAGSLGIPWKERRFKIGRGQ